LLESRAFIKLQKPNETAKTSLTLSVADLGRIIRIMYLTVPKLCVWNCIFTH
jgi:hypothetical protein